MAFYGKTFIFDETACDELELMLYDVGSQTQSAGRFAAGVEAVENTVGSNWKPHFYGVKYDEKLEFELVFGVNQRRLDEEHYLDRYEIETIASWLVGHQQYKWLEVQQNDMEWVRYRCMITSLELVESGQIPWALHASVTCDGPYAYTYLHEYRYTINGSAEILFMNESSHNGYLYPALQFEMSSGTAFSVQNRTDDGRTFSMNNIPSAVQTITVDNATGVIQNNAGVNLYDNCNFQFLRLKKGYNSLYVTGNGILTISAEFPINVGG